MVRILGVNLPDEKRIEVSLTYFFGVGRSTSLEILKKAGIDPNLRTKDLGGADLDKIKNILEKEYKIEGDLRRIIGADIKRLKEINCYRGIRHKLNLPVRGQRTRTNARTKRGKRVTVGSGRKPPAQKT